MQASELKKPLLEAKETLEAAGAILAAKDIGGLLDLIDSQADVELDQFLLHVQRQLDPSAHKSVLRTLHVSALRNALLDEAKFKLAMNALRAEKALDKTDVLSVAKNYGVIRIAGKSRDGYLESIEKYFYWALYNRDADEMAKRATPW